MFADHYGRKKSMLFAQVFGMLAFLCFGYATHFYHFLLANILVGGMIALFSGADRAFLYDSLKAIKKERSYAKVFGRLQGIQTLVWGTMGFVSGSLALLFGFRPLFL
ncbi:MAG: hypothetical protein QW594_04615 [Candidatus Woesearchaeota archaeon]